MTRERESGIRLYRRVRFRRHGMDRGRREKRQVPEAPVQVRALGKKGAKIDTMGTSIWGDARTDVTHIVGLSSLSHSP